MSGSRLGSGMSEGKWNLAADDAQTWQNGGIAWPKMGPLKRGQFLLKSSTTDFKIARLSTVILHAYG